MRLKKLIGTSGRERAVTLATAGLAVLAVVAFFVLDSPDDDPADRPDPALLALDRKCVETKQLLREDAAGKLIDGEGGRLLRAIRDLQLQVRVSQVGRAEELEQPLRSMRAALADLGASLSSDDTADAQAAVASANAAAADFDRAVTTIGLERCSRLQLAPG